jgi:sterol desaturase/sphingolipid hydroxylase (fatty acid hydroxylase superfamily)
MLNTLLIQYEGLLRIGFFFGIFGLMAIWELFTPRRILKMSKGARWYTNLGLVFIDTLILRLLLPVQAVGVSLLAGNNGWGLLNHAALPYCMTIVIGVVGLDFVIYIQHVIFHTIPAFWNLHKVHHTDLDFDVTTGIRFHPIEILLSMGIKMATIIFLGIPATAVIIFEIILNGASMFNHGNVRFPAQIDRFARLLVVTPEMHRVHHSVLIKELNSNFGFSLSWWDRLLGTYRDQPEKGHEGMVIGLGQFRDPKTLTLSRLLILPFIRKPSRDMDLK